MAEGRIQGNQITITMSPNATILDIRESVRKPIICSSNFLASRAGHTRKSLEAQRRDIDKQTREIEAALEKAYDKVNEFEGCDLESDAGLKQLWEEAQHKVKDLQEQYLTLRAARESWRTTANRYAEDAADEAEAVRQAALENLLNEAAW
ncbi:uncharacterized protein AB675_1398 [Cyphellophora attinorum]|uniref:Uncharacterized protein n=1 Tax=Cyphellophora attinorum TaxID=1664694 RepID=A0A0N1GWV1_9EURO|nr:uncharacterized protein AB675_1398 [Phialophora attinorum]KPI34442.1 hypothetical protein AB675_1398 [Phialophora attinorum]